MDTDISVLVEYVANQLGNYIVLALEYLLNLCLDPAFDELEVDLLHVNFHIEFWRELGRTKQPLIDIRRQCCRHRTGWRASARLVFLWRAWRGCGRRGSVDNVFMCRKRKGASLDLTSQGRSMRVKLREAAAGASHVVSSLKFGKVPHRAHRHICWTVLTSYQNLTVLEHPASTPCWRKNDAGRGDAVGSDESPSLRMLNPHKWKHSLIMTAGTKRSARACISKTKRE